MGQGFVQAGEPRLQRYRTQHYEIHSDLPREQVQYFGEHMDRVFMEYRKRFRNFRPQREVSMPLYLFREQEQYIAFLRQHNINATNTGGMFFYQRDVAGLATWTRGRPLSDTLEVLQHEGFHQFAFAYIGPDLPIWVNEGLAQYFEDAVVTKNNMYLGLVKERRIASVKQALEQGRAVDFDELLRMTNNDWRHHVQTNAQRADLQYNQAWAVCYFLIHGDNGRYQQAFERYLRLVSTGKASHDAFHEAFGTKDTRAFRQAWERAVVNMNPDPLSTTLSRMTFLGIGLRYLQEQDEREPRTFAQLRSDLTSRGFRVTRTTHGIAFETRASEPTVFEYPLPRGGTAEFELLPPEKAGLPPRIIARNLKPQPTVVWHREDDGTLIQSIVWQ